MVYQLGLLVGAGFGAVCAYMSYGYFQQHSQLMKMRKDLQDQGLAEGGPLSVNQAVVEATQRAKQEPRSSLQKYCLVSGVVLAYDQAQTRTLEALRQNVQKVDPETPLVECLYKNQLKEGKLSAAQGFTHLENRYQVGKLHLMDAQFA